MRILRSLRRFYLNSATRQGMIALHSNMRFIGYKLTIRHGGSIVIRKLDCPEDRFACPICGDLENDVPPWSDAVMLQELRERDAFSAQEQTREELGYAGGSHEICGCCGMEFGCEDIPPEDGSWTMNQIWMEERLIWLRKETLERRGNRAIGQSGVLSRGSFRRAPCRSGTAMRKTSPSISAWTRSKRSYDSKAR